MKRIKHCCRECHFLTREYPDGGRRSWTKEERVTGQMKHKDAASPMCREGVWDAGIDPELVSELEEILDENRKNRCFFIEYSKGMSYDAAAKLQRMRYENRNLKRSYQYTLWGLGIAGVGLVFNAVFQALNFFFK